EETSTFCAASVQDRRDNSANLAMLGMLEIKHQLLLGNKRVLECLLYAVDRSDRHFSSQPRDPFRCRRSRENGVQLQGDLLPIFQTRCEPRILRIRGPLGLAHSFGQSSPEFLLVAHDDQPAVLGVALLRNRGLGPVAVTVLPVPLARGPLPLAPPCNRDDVQSLSHI